MKGVFAALAFVLIGAGPARADPAQHERLAESVAIAGIVLDGVGVYLAARASADADEVSHYRGEWTETQHATERAGQRAASLAAVSLATGTAALATGIALYYLGSRAHGAGVAVTPNSAELAWSVSF